ncbi:DUF2752 domain-containing protein [Actinomadura parmotrematis]|uniref:DUF2752 domain-containing protein n=1 Tax=Actinomadura parmotrematis TaxID=2864039 RepID=A0ABS7FL43_9ACTN|nr:DUF2752 domain-containing protein [Actinomadura parmotrematis]MBW8481076.1 DUF2752 domain-containing protein [Actinomadura parmotrematis]
MTRAPAPAEPAAASGMAGRGRARALAGPAAAAAALAAATAVVGLVDPHEPGHYPTCPFLAVTGWYCPGCGGLRMVNSLVNGHPGAALGSNPLLLVLLALPVYLWARWTWLAARDRPMRSRLFRPWVAWAVLAAVAVFGIVRNLPFAHVLAP